MDRISLSWVVHSKLRRDVGTNADAHTNNTTSDINKDNQGFLRVLGANKEWRWRPSMRHEMEWGDVLLYSAWSMLRWVIKFVAGRIRVQFSCMPDNAIDTITNATTSSSCADATCVGCLRVLRKNEKWRRWSCMRHCLPGSYILLHDAGSLLRWPEKQLS